MISLSSHLPQIRLLVAFLLSPLIVPVAIYIVSLMAYGIDTYNADKTLATSISSIWYTYLVVLILGAPSLYVLQRKQADNLLNLTIVGAVIGLLSAILLSLFSGSFKWVLYLLFGVSGLLLGVLFWFMALYQPQQNTRLKKRSARRRR